MKSSSYAPRVGSISYRNTSVLFPRFAPGRNIQQDIPNHVEQVTSPLKTHLSSLTPFDRPHYSYYDKHYRMSPALIRARQPFLIKNILTGLGLFSITVGICQFSSTPLSRPVHHHLVIALLFPTYLMSQPPLHEYMRTHGEKSAAEKANEGGE